MTGNVKTCQYEVALSVSAYDGDFEACAADTAAAEAEVRRELTDPIGAEGVGLLTFSAEFVEFDSPNPSHAAGYFDVTVSGPADVVDLVACMLEDEGGRT